MNTLLVLLQTAAPTQQGGGISFWIMMIAIIVIFWLFFIRPQNKKAKEQRKFRDELAKGDKVVTIGGIHGKIDEVKEHTVLLSVDSNTKIEIEKSAINKEGSPIGQ